MLITEAAIFYSRLTKWDEHFSGLPVHAIPVSMYFQLAFEAVSDLGFSSQVTVDIYRSVRKETVLRCVVTPRSSHLKSSAYWSGCAPLRLRAATPLVSKPAKCWHRLGVGLCRSHAHDAAPT